LQGLSCLILVFLALGTAVYPASGASDPAGEISRAVESDGILHPSLGFRIAFEENDALLSTCRHPRASRRDLKVDALLLARRMGVDVSPLKRNNDRVRLKTLELQLALALDRLENNRRLSGRGSLDAR